MAFHPGEYRIASAISSLKTQKANQWHYLNLPFGLFYSYYKLFEMTSCYAICSQSSLKSLTKPKPHSKSQESTLQESSSFFSFLFLFTDKLRNPSSSLNSQMGFMNVLKFSAACFDLLAWYVVHAFSRHRKILENEVEFYVWGETWDFLWFLHVSFISFVWITHILVIIVCYLFGFLLSGLSLHWAILCKSWS